MALIIKKGQRDVIKFYTALIQGRSENCTHGFKSLTTLLVKHYNDLLDRQSCVHIPIFKKKSSGDFWENFVFYIFPEVSNIVA